ncbi:ankyrin repeat protein, partial [Ostertagia ostertagi]
MRGRNALHLAVLTHSEITVKLFECMKNMTEMPTSGLPRGITPFHLAAVNNRAKPLLRLAKEVEKRTDKAAKKRVLVDRPLFAYTDVKNRIPLHYAMKYGHLDPTAVLLSQQGAELCLTWRDKDEMTPLHFAAANGKNACIDWVLRKFSKISVNRKDAKGRSCGMLSLTSLSGPFWPLVRKSNLERCDNMGRGYLHRAVYSRNKELLIRVLERCNPNVRDINGVTPLHVAAAVGESEAAIMLIQCGANRLAPDKRGFTPIDWAAAYNKVSISEDIAGKMKDNRSQ